jgi:hypothetical protein
MKLRWVETDINRSIFINCLVAKCPFPAPNGHHHERSMNVFSVLSTFFHCSSQPLVSSRDGVHFRPEKDIKSYAWKGTKMINFAPVRAFRNCLSPRYFTQSGRGIGYSFQLAITAPLYSITGYCIATAQS